MAKKTRTKDMLYYKGKPLVRRGNLIYYGNPEDKYIILFTINSTKKIGDTDVADSVTIQLKTNFGNGKEKVIRQAERDGLYSAIDIGEFWLEDALGNV